ncbi:MAG: fimbrial protein [Enterobacteriaceae bacterium]|nr:fimbrial protein [Enterobacteriaceae bacterium]
MKKPLHNMLLSLLLPLSAASYAADSGTLTFTSTLVSSGTCTISFSPESPLDLGETNANDLIGQDREVTNVKEMTLTLSNCPKISDGPAPMLTLKGDANKDNAVPVDRRWLFKSSGTSIGFGIVVSREEFEGTPKFYQDRLYFSDEPTEFKLGKPGTVIKGLTKVFKFGLTCGSEGGCKRENVQNGTLKMGTLRADFTFEFAYK